MRGAERVLQLQIAEYFCGFKVVCRDGFSESRVSEFFVTWKRDLWRLCRFFHWQIDGLTVSFRLVSCHTRLLLCETGLCVRRARTRNESGIGSSRCGERFCASRAAQTFAAAARWAFFGHRSISYYPIYRTYWWQILLRAGPISLQSDQIKS